MAMNGDTLGNAIGVALYNAIPGSVLECMTSEAKAQMCASLIDNAKVIANCVVSHIVANAQVAVTVCAGIAVTAGSCVGATTAPGSGSGTIS